MTYRWYVGFDCATKTFAFSIGRIQIDPGFVAAADARLKKIEALLARMLAAGSAAAATAGNPDIADIRRAVDKLGSEIRNCIRIVDGETVDLFKGRADSDIATVERVRAVSRYVATRVRPALLAATGGEPYQAIIEYQMGPNARARTVSTALVTLFCDEAVVLVGPSLKNKVAVTPQGRYGLFTEKHLTTYAANKAHAKYNFTKLEELFGSTIPHTSAASRGHIADSFMQILGFLMFVDKNAKEQF